ncbi:hypothetical protein [Thalassotalea sp. PLHSN55]|uniref:hypothetical protein n=1 Tax=Thalassotalea sp. PLHSN55 TaxID=3435888 RepID=UPI003F829680
MNELVDIEIPFDKRHHCWFCGEPSSTCFVFPNQVSNALGALHQQINVPSCVECHRWAVQAEAKSIFAVKHLVKQKLMYKYRKDLAIGLNWTKQELANSGFEGGNFASFQKSAWFMFEVAQGRVNYLGWPIVVNGVALELDEDATQFIFDGVTYPSIDDAIAHYCHVFYLDKKYFIKVLYLLGQGQFAKAVRFCRLLIDASANEKQQAFVELLNEQA